MHKRNRYYQLTACRIRRTDITARYARYVHDTHIGGHVRTELQIQLHTEFPFIILLVGIMVGCARFHPSVTTRTARVTDDIEDVNIGFSSMEGGGLQFLAGDISAEDLTLHHVALVLQCRGHGTERHVAGEGNIQIIHGQQNGTPALLIQIIRNRSSGGVQTVVYPHLASPQRNTDESPRLRVVIIIILLICSGRELVAPFVDIDRIA